MRTAKRRNMACNRGRFFTCEQGNSAIEYALILAVIATVVILALKSFAPDLLFQSVADTADFKSKANSQRAANKAHADLEETAEVAAEAPPRPVPWFEIAMVGASFLAGGAYLFERMRVRREQKLQEETAEETRFRRETALDPVQQPRFIAKRQQILRFITRRHDESNTRIRVGDVMTAKLTVVTPNTKLDEIRRMVKERHMRHMLVVNADGTLAGIISDRDLAQRKGRRAADIMTADPLTVPEDMVVSEAIRLMVCHGISCLPVTGNNFPMGLLTTTDLLLAFQCAQQLLKQVASAAPDPTRSCAEGLASISSADLQANLHGETLVSHE